MKKSALYIGMAMLMSTAFAHASDPTESATVTITGNVSGSNPGASCGVYPSLNSININQMGNDIVEQGSEPDVMGLVTLRVANPDDLSGCNAEIAAGHIALKLHGQADDAQGTSLANTEKRFPASGVAIGLFNYDTKEIIAINDTVLDIDKDSDSAKLGLELVKLAGQNMTDGNVKGSLTIDIIRL